MKRTAVGFVVAVVVSLLVFAQRERGSLWSKKCRMGLVGVTETSVTERSDPKTPPAVVFVGHIFLDERRRPSRDY